MTLYDVLRARRRTLTGIRVALALLVLISHAFPLSGLGGDPAWPGLPAPATSVGNFAVGGFFALSGMLVAMSAIRHSAAEFAVARILRIFPAFAVVLVVSAAVLGPLVAVSTGESLAEYVSAAPGGPLTYIFRNLTMPVGLQFGINDLFLDTTPYGVSSGVSTINGSLWTLPLEMRSYVIVFLVVVIGRWVGRIVLVTATALALSVGAVALRTVRPEFMDAVLPDLIPPSLLPLLAVFLCGSVLGTVADRIRFDWRLVGGAALVYIVAMVIGGQAFTTFGFGSLAVLLPALALVLPFEKSALLDHDVSYGTYIWAFPVQQVLAHLGLANELLPYIGMSIGITLVLAVVSWLLVERPSMRLRSRILRDRAPRPPEALPTR